MMLKRRDGPLSTREAPENAPAFALSQSVVLLFK